MDVEAILRAATLPEPPMDTEVALDRAYRGAAVRQRRRGAVRTAALAVVVLLLLLLALFVVTDGPRGLPFFSSSEPARWEVDPAALPTVDSTAITIRVFQVSCNDGNINPPHEPEVKVREEQITISVSMDPPTAGMHSCPGSLEGRPLEVDLGEPIGDRALVDGNACERCSDVRWVPAGPDGVPVAGRMETWNDTGTMVPWRGSVEVLGPSGDVVTTATTDEQGRFALELPNGRYRLIGRAEPRADGTTPQCHDPRDLPREIVVVGLAIDAIQVACA